jgi:hypothetical protein
LKGARGRTGEKGKQGAAGAPGKGSLVTGSIFTNTGPTASEVDGNDESLLSDTLSILKNSGLDVDEIVTVKPTLDENDLSNIKTKIRLSNGLFNWIAKWLIPKLPSTPDSSEKFFISTGSQPGQWTWKNSGYKCQSSSLVECGPGAKAFSIGEGYSWTAGVVARAVSGPNLVEGTVFSYISGVLTITVDYFVGSGTFSDWIINIGTRNAPSARLGDYVITQLPDGYVSPVIMNGCVVIKDGTNYTHTGGQIYYQGNTYQVDEVISPITSVSEPKWGASGEKFVLMSSGGTSQWNQTRRLEHIQFNRKRELYEIITIPKMPSLSFFTDNFDTNGVGYPYKKYEGFEIATGAFDSVDMAGKTTLGINFRDTSWPDVRLKSTDDGAFALNTYFPVGSGISWDTLIGQFVGKWKHALTASENGPHSHSYTVGSNGGDGIFPEAVERGNNNDGDYTTNTSASGTGSPHNILQPSVISIIIQKVAEIS